MDANSAARPTSDGSDLIVPSDTAPRTVLSRRRFLGRGSAVAVTTAAALAGIAPDLTSFTASSTVHAAEIGPLLGSARADRSRDIRAAAAAFQRSIAVPDHPDNGDESRYADRSASFQKVLQHDDNGDVIGSEYDQLLRALRSGNAADFENLTLPGDRNLVNPLAAYAYQLEGADSHALALPPAPEIASDQVQGEMAELYWMALARDISFDNYAVDGSGIVQAAVDDLNRFRDFRGPKQNGSVTRASLFRDVLPDNLVGNYVSQFLLKTVPYGAQRIVQASRTRVNGDDRITNWDEWLQIQRGFAPSARENYDGTVVATTVIRPRRSGLVAWIRLGATMAPPIAALT